MRCSSCCFFVGMSYLDPPPESGIAINFGASDTGQGAVQPKAAIASAPRNTAPEPEPETEKTAEIKEEVVTQEIEEAPVIKEEPKKEEKKPVVEKPKEEPKKPVEEVKNQTPSQINPLQMR